MHSNMKVVLFHHSIIVLQDNILLTDILQIKNCTRRKIELKNNILNKFQIPTSPNKELWVAMQYTCILMSKYISLRKRERVRS